MISYYNIKYIQSEENLFDVDSMGINISGYFFKCRNIKNIHSVRLRESYFFKSNQNFDKHKYISLKMYHCLLIITLSYNKLKMYYINKNLTHRFFNTDKLLIISSNIDVLNFVDRTIEKNLIFL